jgi:membrane protease YdiL (CAAX protease family)
MSSTEKTESGAGRRVSATEGTGLVGFVRRRPLTAFLLWFFTVGQVFAFIPVVARANGVELISQPFIVTSTLVGLLLPAVVITRIVDGPDGVRQFWWRCFAVWVSLRWYALALVALPLVTIALAVAFFGMPPVDLTASVIVSALVYGLLLQTVLAFVPNNWAEEAAWMGFFQARLQQRRGAMLAALITAPLFALQHVSLAFGNPLLLGVLLMLFLAVVNIPFRAVMAWSYNHTGSLFLVGFIHAVGNAVAGSSGFGSGFLPRLYPGKDFVGLLHLLAFAIIGVVVIIATRARLGLSSRQAPASSSEEQR